MAARHRHRSIFGEPTVLASRGGDLEQAGEVAHRFWGSERREAHRDRCSMAVQFE
jgi:hypothetical protein